MSEQTQRRLVVSTLRCLDAVSVENPVYPGTPDVNYVEGWIELKWARKWPVGASTPFRLPHFTQQQKVWLRRRVARGGVALVLLQVGREWLLFDGEVAAQNLGSSTRSQLRQLALHRWDNGLDKKDFIECLIQLQKKT